MNETLRRAFDILDRAWDGAHVARKKKGEIIARLAPAAVVGMYSSGDDSGAVMFALEQWSKARSIPFEVAHINTGIGIEESRSHAREVAALRDWRFAEWKTDPQRYIQLVRGELAHRNIPGGFPGAPLHPYYYRVLKDRRVDEMMRYMKRVSPRAAQVLLVSGVRKQESARRMGYAKETNKRGSQLWVNPLLDASKDDCLDLMELGNLPRNPASTTLHMSGECLCGAMNAPGELAEIRYWFPDAAAYIDAIAAQVRAAGFSWGWDEKRPKWFDQIDAGQTPLFDFMPLCVGCEARRAPETDAAL